MTGAEPVENQAMQHDPQDVDPETGRRRAPPRRLVFTETRMFGPDLAHHAVEVHEHENDRLRLFERPFGGGIGRRHDRTNDVLYHSQRREDFERHRFDSLPITEYHDFASFLRTIGYRWGRNTYGKKTKNHDRKD